MPDEMIFSPDKKSLRRGKRHSPRTETCRPCLVWPTGDDAKKLLGVVMDVSPHGMRVRMIDILPTDLTVMIQLMRDDDYREALSRPVEGCVVRYECGAGGFTDHGISLSRREIQRAPLQVPELPGKRPPRAPAPSRMHTIDLTVGERRRGRFG